MHKLRGWFAASVAAVVMACPAAAQVKHIILFIGDGMQMAAEVGTSRYLFGKDDGLSFHQLPYKGVVATWDVSSYNARAKAAGKPAYDPKAIHPSLGYDAVLGGLLPYPLVTTGDAAYLTGPATDSASAATAWATGYKTDDGNIAWLPGDPPDGRLATVAEILRREKGFSIGVVSTVPFTHATPAAQVSHNVSRNNYHAIGDEIVMQTQPEVVIGGGYASNTYLPSAALTYLTADPKSPYVFVQRQAGVDGAQALAKAAAQATAQGKKLFGLFGNPSSGNFESPVPADSPGAPSVKRATVENPLLKDAVVAALDVLKRDRDGFFVLFEQGDIDWAAHANDFARMVGTTWDLHEAVKTAIEYIDRPGDDLDWSNTLLVVTADHANSFLRLVKPLGPGDLPAQSGKQYPDGEVSFRSGNHTNELVRLYARGAAIDTIKKYEGAWYPCTTIIDNTQLFHVFLGAAGVDRPSPLNAIPDRSACALAGAVGGQGR